MTAERDRLAELITEAVDAYAPTHDDASICRYLADRLIAAGIHLDPPQDWTPPDLGLGPAYAGYGSSSVEYVMGRGDEVLAAGTATLHVTLDIDEERLARALDLSGIGTVDGHPPSDWAAAIAAAYREAAT